MIEGLNPYPSMKVSGVPWLGEVPEHWELRRMKTLLRERVEKGHPEEPLLAATQLKGVVRKEQYENRTVLALKDLHLLKLVLVGDFVISLRSFQGGIEIAHEQGIISPAYTILYSADSGLRSYAARLFKSAPFIDNLSLFVTGIRQGQNIDYEKLGCAQLPLPPPEEQAAIVRYLDHADRKIRRYIRAKQKLIKLLAEQKQAIIHRAVTRGLDPNVRLKPSGVEWLGDVPEHWEIRRAKAVCSDIVDCKNRTPDAVEGGDFLVVRTTCVRDGKFDASGGYTTDAENFRIWTSRGAPQLGDVFFTREAPAGEACLVPDKADLCMGQRMMYFRPNPELLDPEFLLLNIYGPLTRTYIELETNGSTVGHLRLGQVYSLPLVWCPVEEQRAIVAQVHAVSQGLEQAQASAKQEIALLREYRTRLIADVVTGKLDVREAAAGLPEHLDAEEFDASDYNEEDDDIESTSDLQEGDDT